MPRALRIEFPGAIYHVMARGQRRELIFRSDSDRSEFLELLGKACQRYSWQVIGYVLMGNHYHLLLETAEANLAQGMHWLQTTFSTRHRLRHGLSGVIFGGRYKALLIERDGRHLGTVLDYIHLNPWRAGLVALEIGLETYQWSSLVFYVLPPRQRPGWLNVVGGLTWLDVRDTAAGRRKFLENLEDRARGGTRLKDQAKEILEVETDWEAQLRRGWCFGSERFRELMLEKAGETLSQKSRPQEVNEVVRKDVSEHRARRLLAKGCALWGLPIEELQARAKGDAQKVALGWVIREQTSVPLDWLSKNLNMGAQAAVCRLLGKWKKPHLQSKQERQWLKELNEISI